jgi:mono/diheme cytochrome c family protein
MPPDLVTGEDADDVAVYVGRYAGNPDLPPSAGDEGITATDGAEIFAQAGCGSCHVLAAAGSTGEIGPNLDEAKPTVELAIDRITNGRGAMPAFGGQLSEEQIRAVAEFVAQSAGG